MPAPFLLPVVRVAAIAAALVATGAVLRPVARSARAETDGAFPAAGFRALAADAVWLQANVAWERRDPVATDRLVRLATTLDPRPLEFWINGARALGYDLSEWEIAAAGGEAKLGATAVAELRARHAANAIALLETARAAHPASPALEIELAQLHWLRRRDAAAAAEHFRRAAALPGAPDFAARLHVALLAQLRRESEAPAGPGGSAAP